MQSNKEMELRKSDSLFFPGSLRFDRFSSGVTLTLLVLLFAAALPDRAWAAAQLMVVPTRVIFQGRTRTASVTVINGGDKTATFRISFEHMRMTANGSLVLMKKVSPGERFADQMVRYAPRQVTLRAGQSQVVRLMLRKPPNLPDGEYRAHMLFRALPSDTGSNISQEASHTHGLVVRLIPIVGVAIPVIVRQGNTSATATLANLHLDKRSADGKRAILAFTVRRSGNQSVYGDFTVRFTPAKSSSSLVVGRVDGIAVYTPNTHRSMTIVLQAPNGVRLQKGTLDIEYRTSPSAGNKVLAQAHTTIRATGR